MSGNVRNLVQSASQRPGGVALAAQIRVHAMSVMPWLL
jgi:hypothetical protein